MNSYLSKDYLDSFYSKAVDEHYDKQKTRCFEKSINNLEKKMKKTNFNLFYYDSTSAEEDSSEAKIDFATKSIFNKNLFEKKRKILKIGDVLTYGWRENVIIQKSKILTKILKKTLNNSFFSHN